MQFIIEDARNEGNLKAIQHLENRVFRLEKGIDLPPFAAVRDGAIFRLVARALSNGVPVGTLSVVESNEHRPWFGRYESLIANRGGRVARYTRLAVLPEYRGHNLSMRLILEAQRRFVAPENIQHTWLLFDAARASNSLLSRLLRFRCGSAVIRAEYGACRLLIRDELSISAQIGNRHGWAYLTALAASESVRDVEPPCAHLFDATSCGKSMSIPPAT
jgi:GNAT superfamily N-acetyltransferase